MFRFPWGDMHSLNLGWFLQKFNELREDWATAEAGIDGALDAEIQRAEDALSDVFDARDAAAASATAAAGSASAAGTSATAAQNSATAAGNSATLANNKATAAGLSEAAAAQSAQQAGNSATAAAGSATTASTAATNAAASETAAGNSASAAAGSATAAATSETNAAASAARAEEVEESIPEDYSDLSNAVTEMQNSLNGATKNLYKTNKRTFTTSGVTAVFDTNGKITLNGTATSTGGRTTFMSSSFLLKAGTYTFSCNILSVACAGFIQEGTTTISSLNLKDGGGKTTFTLNADTQCNIGINVTQNEVYNNTELFIQIEEGSQVTQFSPPASAADYVAREAIAIILDEMIADKNLSVNDFRLVNGHLLRVTSPIVQGAALVIGTNVETTTIGTILKTIL